MKRVFKNLRTHLADILYIYIFSQFEHLTVEELSRVKRIGILLPFVTVVANFETNLKMYVLKNYFKDIILSFIEC